MVSIAHLNLMTGKCGCNVKFCWVSLVMLELREMEMVMRKIIIEGIVTEAVAE